MEQPLKELKVVLASPSDVQQERDYLAHVIDELNRTVAPIARLTITLLRWETDTYPGFHVLGPQGLIDEALRIEECDVLIGIFWKRVGTRIADGTTGTQHEVFKAYEAWKRTKRPG